MLIGLTPMGKGLPGTGLSTPVLDVMENTEMLKEPELPT